MFVPSPSPQPIKKRLLSCFGVDFSRAAARASAGRPFRIGKGIRRQTVKPTFRIPTFLHAIALSLLFVSVAAGQAPEGPQSDAPAPATTPVAPAARPAGNGQTILIPTGTRIGVLLESGISTATAKPGDSVYFRTSFPITIDNKVVVPVGSYLRGEVTESKRPGHIKGRGELRIRLSTLVLPNGYTVDLNAEPRSTDSASNTKTDSEGKITGPGGKGKDVQTVATTTV